MNTPIKHLFVLLLTLTGMVILSSFFPVRHAAMAKSAYTFPYKQAGLTERQAAAHLLSRFTYGATPGQVDEVVKIGLEKWFEQQLDGNLPDDSLNNMLNQYDALKLSNAQIIQEFPRNNVVLRMAVRDKVISQDSVNKGDRRNYQMVLQNYMDQHGMKPVQELYRQFYNQKVLRAAYSNNQLREVLTDFWFNHFNVSMTKNDCAEYIPDYERDVIRPNVTSKFGDLLLATAKSPAMLYYLDNFTSAGPMEDSPAQRRRVALLQNNMQDNPQATAALQRLQNSRKQRGLNENYAREVMELHTLGVDGGYTQQDVTQAARVLTGWTVTPMGAYGGNGAMMMGHFANAGKNGADARGNVREGDFMFAANRHDNGEKTVLGKKFGPEGGYQEGVDLLEMLAHHPSAAKFITRKIAVRFVSDIPPQSLLDKMAKTFLKKDGSIREVLITMVNSPEFWSPAALREKTKSPFELAISSVRALHAQIGQPYQLYAWANKMGQKLYAYQAPTGFPDKGQYWINTGALLSRMNFGLALAAQRIPGVKIDLPALNNHHEPESPAAALATYSKLMMPERNLTSAIKQLTPMLNQPQLDKKVNEAAGQTAAPAQQDAGQNMMMADAGVGGGRRRFGNNNNMQIKGDNSMLAQVVGIIVGSPEFQRR